MSAKTKKLRVESLEPRLMLSRTTPTLAMAVGSPGDSNLVAGDAVRPDTIVLSGGQAAVRHAAAGRHAEAGRLRDLLPIRRIRQSGPFEAGVLSLRLGPD